ncbi:MAG: hypothetical protein U5L96_10875 [Owenweeksia sp.]|nr:hypothetical protein [Owenweeksia sp.]
MSRFLRKLLVFSLIPLLYFGVNGLINWHLISKSSVDTEKAELLIMGDSHLQKALDPNAFNKALSFAQESEPYVVTYWKLKKILANNDPNTIIIGFAPQNLSAFNDLKFSNDFWAAEMFKRTYPISNYGAIDTIVPIDYPTFYKVIWRQTGFFPRQNHKFYLGRV